MRPLVVVSVSLVASWSLLLRSPSCCCWGFQSTPQRQVSIRKASLLSNRRRRSHPLNTRWHNNNNNNRFSRTELILTSKDVGEPNQPPASIIQRAITKFKSRPGTYLLIPCVAAFVGWITNWMAVQMIFYPIQFRGIPIYRQPEVPLGLIGWQGIVPCKTRKMSEAMVNMVTSELITVKEVFSRLEPKKVAQILAPEVPKLTNEILQDIMPLKWMVQLPGALYNGLDNASQAIVKLYTKDFLQQLTRAMQANIDSIFHLKSCVVDQMLRDRSKLGQLFWKCGQKELDFLTNSGLWFGFLLGLIQMMVALVWDNPWSLSIGGGIVGYATNWLALKWIFEPVDPVQFGPFRLQGQFLRRQKEVSREFSKFFANNILTSEKLWNSVFTDPQTQPSFAALFSEHFMNFVNKITRGFRFALEPETLRLATSKALAKLPSHVPVLYPYMDSTLGLEETLRVRMEQMSSRKFERVLHPIFEEDELTLILAGAVLGFAAGLIQQGLETGAIKVPDIRKGAVDFIKTPRKQSQYVLSQIRQWSRRIVQRIQRPFTGISSASAAEDSDQGTSNGLPPPSSPDADDGDGGDDKGNNQ